MRRQTATALPIAVLLAAIALLPVTRVHAASVKTEQAACAAAKTRVAAIRHFPVSEVASCDIISAADSPWGYYVLALYSSRNCDGICSTNIGWFAIQKATGRVFEWNVVKMEVGPIFTGP